MAEETEVMEENPVDAIHREDFEQRMNQLRDVSDSDTARTEQRDALGTDDGETARTPRRGASPQEIEAFLKEQGQEGMAESFKKTFSTVTRLQQEQKRWQQDEDTRIKAALEQALREHQAEQEGLDPEDPMAQITPEQKKIFRRLLEEQAAELGYVKSDDLTQKEHKSWMAQANAEAVEAFPDLGELDDRGELILSDEAKESMVPIYERLNDPARGWAYPDLYKLANFDRLIAEAEERGRSSRDQNTQQRVQRVQRGQTERPGVPVTPQVNIRKERGTPEDRRDRQNNGPLARAFALARRQNPT